MKKLLTVNRQPEVEKMPEATMQLHTELVCLEGRRMEEKVKEG